VRISVGTAIRWGRMEDAVQNEEIEDAVVDELLVDELLVEEVSIDGMCGVY
jgi:mycofactocin precursor